jgi:hypothetical protein
MESRTGRQRVFRKFLKLVAVPALTGAVFAVAVPASAFAANTSCHEDAGWHYDVKTVISGDGPDWIPTMYAPNTGPTAKVVTVSISGTHTFTASVSAKVSVSTDWLVASASAELTTTLEDSISLTVTESSQVTIPPHYAATIHWSAFQKTVTGDYYYLQPSCAKTSEVTSLVLKAPYAQGPWEVWARI